MSDKILYTAKIVSTRLFEDTQSLSITAVCKTANGSLIVDQFVRFSLSVTHPIGENILAGLVSEIGFRAAGFSADPILKGDASRNLAPVYAIVGLDRQTIQSLLSVKVQRGTKITDKQELARGRGMAARAAEWVKSALESAKG